MCWTTLAGLVGAAGVFAALQEFGVVASIAVLLSAGVLGGTVALSLASIWPMSLRTVVVSGVVTGAVVVLGAGLCQVMGGSALMLLATVTLTAPPFTDLVWRRTGHAADPVEEGVEEPVVLVPVDAPPVEPEPLDRPTPPGFFVSDRMEDEDLCLAWCSSFVALERADSVESRLRVVRIRQIYLDELERRDGAAMEAWIASGPRAASDPGKYLGAVPGPDAAA